MDTHIGIGIKQYLRREIFEDIDFSVCFRLSPEKLGTSLAPVSRPARAFSKAARVLQPPGLCDRTHGSWLPSIDHYLLTVTHYYGRGYEDRM